MSEKNQANPKDNPVAMDVDGGDVGNRHPLTRIPADGMNPTNLLTGLYGARGERVRHLVHEGALRLPTEALDLIGPTDAATSSRIFQLPGLDSVVRMSADPKVTSMRVTEITGKLVPSTEPEQPPTFRTFATNKTVVTGSGPERLRGGGDDNDEEIKAPAPTAAPTEIAERTAATVTSSEPVATHSSVVATVDKAPSVGVPEQTSTAPSIPAETILDSQPVLSLSLETSAPSLKRDASLPVSSEISGTPAPVALEPIMATSLSVAPPTKADERILTKTEKSETVPPASVSAPDPVTKTSSATEVKPVQSTPEGRANKETSKSEETVPDVVALSKTPAPQWEQHIPGPSDEMQVDPASKTPKPDWYDAARASEIEKSVLVEWFDQSASHRTEESYVQAREGILKIAAGIGNRYVSATMVRRSVPGDAGSLLRLHAFLTSYAFINEDSMNDSAPTPVTLQQEVDKRHLWNDELKRALLDNVVEQSRKRPKLLSSDTNENGLVFDWNAVAAAIGNGMDATECERQFLSLPMDDLTSTTERPITPEPSLEGTPLSAKGNGELRAQVLQDIVDNSDPDVLRAATQAVFAATEDPTANLAALQNTTVASLLAGQALAQCRKEEANVANLLAGVVDLRMQKLENRLTLLDDLEGLLEAERVALELERRDLYTARCRHWFGGP